MPTIRPSIIGLAFVGAIPLILSAAPLASLNSFSNGEIALAEDVNGNFAAIEEVLNAAVVGTATSPGRSCLHILESGGSTGDGTYTVRGVGGGTRTVWCDMTIEGGGWTLILNKLGNFAQTGWSRVDDTTGLGHLTDATTKPASDNKDILARIPGDEVLLRKIGTPADPEMRVVTSDGSSWASFYDGFFGVNGNFCRATETGGSWVTKFSYNGLICDCKGGGEGCYVALSPVIEADTSNAWTVCDEGNSYVSYLGDASTTFSAGGTHFLSASGGCISGEVTTGWTRLYVR